MIMNICHHIPILLEECLGNAHTRTNESWLTDIIAGRTYFIDLIWESCRVIPYIYFLGLCEWARKTYGTRLRNSNWIVWRQLHDHCWRFCLYIYCHCIVKTISQMKNIKIWSKISPLYLSLFFKCLNHLLVDFCFNSQIHSCKKRQNNNYTTSHAHACTNGPFPL
jgi:hypothetical protein